MPGCEGSCTKRCTVDLVKKPESGVRILHVMFAINLSPSTWNSWSWQSNVSNVGFKPLEMYHLPLKSAILKFLTRADGSGTGNSPTSDFLGTHFLRETAQSLNSSTTLFSNRSPHLIWWMIKAEHKRLIFLADFSELKVYGINLAFSFIRSIIACVQACYVCCTGRVRYAFGQFYSVKGKIS